MKAKVKIIKPDTFSGTGKNGSPFSFFSMIFFDQEREGRFKADCSESEQVELCKHIGKNGIAEFDGDAARSKCVFVAFHPAAA
jgi:hypothetical protein